MWLVAPLLSSLLLAPSSHDGVEVAELVLKNGNVFTLDAGRPRAQALAARDGRLVAIGADRDMAAYIGEGTRVIDLDGALAIPGFIEGHGHFMGIGSAKLQLDLMNVANWAEIVALVESAVQEAKPGEVIRGRGWHQEKWDELPADAVKGLPIHHALSAVSPDNPVVLTHASGHACFVNAKVMEICQIAGDTEPPDGGQIVCDAQGQPIGMLRETAQSLTRRLDFSSARPDARRLALLAQEECLRKGITSFQDAGSSFSTVDALKGLVDSGELKIRLWVMLRVSNDSLRKRLPGSLLIGHGDHRLTCRSIKRSIDGALGPHGAWLMAAYEDMPESSGLNTAPVPSVEETARLALDHGFQLCVHAIGDRANHEVLNIFERTFAGVGNPAALRWRIEHAQHIHPGDVPRFGQMGVIASMQGVHCTSDAIYVLQRLGELRSRTGAYVWRDLLRTGAVVINGTDAPVEDVDPIASYHATVSRRLKDGSVFFPEQRMTRTEALRSYTLDAAYAAFEEDLKGSLSVGKLADVTVLSRDILTCDESDIRDAEVLYTVVGGEVLYRRN